MILQYRPRHKGKSSNKKKAICSKKHCLVLMKVKVKNDAQTQMVQFVMSLESILLQRVWDVPHHTLHNTQVGHQMPCCTMKMPNPRPCLDRQELGIPTKYQSEMVFQSQLLKEGLCRSDFKHFGRRYSHLLDSWRCHLKGEQYCFHAESNHLSLFQQRV